MAVLNAMHHLVVRKKTKLGDKYVQYSFPRSLLYFAFFEKKEVASNIDFENLLLWLVLLTLILESCKAEIAKRAVFMFHEGDICQVLNATFVHS